MREKNEMSDAAPQSEGYRFRQQPLRLELGRVFGTDDPDRDVKRTLAVTCQAVCTIELIPSDRRADGQWLPH
jgi:hypothetical protein